MGDSSLERIWIRAIGVRATLLGIALGVLGLAGGALLLGSSPADSRTAAVLLTAIMLPLGVGIWVAGPGSDREPNQLRERWLAAAAFVAVAGAFASFANLYQQIYPGIWWRMLLLLVIIAAPAYMLGLLVPVLFTWAEAGVAQEEEIDPVRAALGPLSAGIFVGVCAAALFTGFVFLPRWNPAVLLMLLALVLLIPLGLVDPTEAPTEEEVVYQSVTPFGTLQVIDIIYPGERQPERRLYLNGEEESGQLVRSGAPTLAYIAAAEHWLTQITPPGGEYLFLGGGAYTLPRRIAERDSAARIVVVELDPEVTRIARSYFGLRRQPGIRSVEGDARAYLEQQTGERFDRIYVDVYGGRELLPYTLITREAALLLARSLAPGGVVGINLIGTLGDLHDRQVWSIVKTVGSVFPSLSLYTHLGESSIERQNLLLAASPDPERSFPARAGHFELWPRNRWPEVPGTTIFRDLQNERAAGSEPGSGGPKSEGRVSLPSD